MERRGPGPPSTGLMRHHEGKMGTISGFRLPKRLELFYPIATLLPKLQLLHLVEKVTILFSTSCSVAIYKYEQDWEGCVV